MGFQFVSLHPIENGFSASGDQPPARFIAPLYGKEVIRAYPWHEPLHRPRLRHVVEPTIGNDRRGRPFFSTTPESAIP